MRQELLFPTESRNPIKSILPKETVTKIYVKRTPLARADKNPMIFWPAYLPTEESVQSIVENSTPQTCTSKPVFMTINMTHRKKNEQAYTKICKARVDRILITDINDLIIRRMGLSNE